MLKPILGYVTAYHMIVYFFVYSFLGWVTEIAYHTLKTGKFVNRGFLNGPVCPIYGTGMAVCVLLLNAVADRWWLLMLAGGALATGLELLTGFVLDKLFNTKWWDYSKEPFNIKGYVCLRFALIWGVAVFVVFKTLVPFTDKLVEIIPFKRAGCVLICVFGAILLADFITVIKQLIKLKENLNETSKIAEILRKDSEFIGKRVSSVTVAVAEKVKTLSEKIEKSRLVKAFPRLKRKNEEMLDEYKNSQEKEENREKSKE